MNDGERQKCTVCEKPLRKGPFKTCPAHRSPEEKRAVWNANAAKARGETPKGDDGVLSRMGFSVKADEAPPATKKSKTKKPAPPASVTLTAVPKWQAAYRALASALGLDPDSMLEEHCRGWVEATRSRALGPPEAPKQLPAGETRSEAA